jgi:hypothetical protein
MDVFRQILDERSPADLAQEHDISRDAIGPFDFLQAPTVLPQEVRLSDTLSLSTNFATVRQVQAGT